MLIFLIIQLQELVYLEMDHQHPVYQVKPMLVVVEVAEVAMDLVEIPLKQLVK
jgi:hypothetical protein